MSSSIPRYVFVDGPGNERLVRDTFSMGVINTDDSALVHAQRRQEEAMRKIVEEQSRAITLQSVQQQVNDLSDDVQAIRQLLEQFLNTMQGK
jgi:uncharacterized protein involved in exopolysaccharide biosynthesis